MTISPRPARSLLFVPGNRGSWMEKALRYGADGLIFDLEDAVPPAQLPQARQLVREFLDAHAGGRTMFFVRVGMPATPAMEEDIRAVTCAGLTGVMLPMVADVADVQRAEALLAQAERDAGVEPGTTILVPLLETATSLRQSYEIATCSARIAYMGAGVSRQGDIARALGFRWTPEGLETLYFRSMVLLNVRAAGIANPVSGVWGRVADLDGLRKFANQTRDLGYAGMLAIHPSHVEVINEIFTPTSDEIASWRQAIDAIAEAHRAGLGTTTIDGQLIDYAHVKTAEQGLTLARQLGLV